MAADQGDALGQFSRCVAYVNERVQQQAIKLRIANFKQLTSTQVTETLRLAR